ncbi:MAG: phosphoglycerate mutase family protein [Pseudomonadales bacterium]|nr:phosphoglycerate mutase family protein [Pseudomonadales bacterium]
MARIYMIRHGRAAAGFSEDADPGLDEIGHQQAIEAAQQLNSVLPVAIVSSPLRRALETAKPLVEISGIAAVIEHRVAEVPSTGLSLSERGPWLQKVMQGYWSEQSTELRSWQDNMVDCLLELPSDTAIFSHFIAINALVAVALEKDQISVCRPDNGSITIFDNSRQKLDLVKLGSAAETKVN